MKQLFCTINDSSSEYVWNTWSDEAKSMLKNMTNELSGIVTKVEQIEPSEQYGLSYIANTIMTPNLNSSIKEIANCLYMFKPSEEIVLLQDLLFDDFGASELHALFSLLSAELCKDRSCTISFHSPIESETADQGFPVHADLFCSRVLFNVISFMDDNDGGDILLLSNQQLQKAMKDCEDMPARAKNIIIKLLTNRSHKDKFNEVFDLMYRQDSWSYELIQKIDERLMRIPTKVGMGYLIIDGLWLHGRSAIRGPVHSKRLQRLVFDNKTTLSFPYVNLSAADNEYIDELLKKTHRLNKKSKSKSLSFKAKSILPNSNIN